MRPTDQNSQNEAGTVNYRSGEHRDQTAKSNRDSPIGTVQSGHDDNAAGKDRCARKRGSGTAIRHAGRKPGCRGLLRDGPSGCETRLEAVAAVRYHTVPLSIFPCRIPFPAETEDHFDRQPGGCWRCGVCFWWQAFRSLRPSIPIPGVMERISGSAFRHARPAHCWAFPARAAA